MLAIKDLTTNKTLDRQAMKQCAGGRGVARSQLFSLWPATSGSGAGGFPASTIIHTVNNYVNQTFIDTLQLNQIDQTVTITDSDNATVGQFGNAQNSMLPGLADAVPV